MMHPTRQGMSPEQVRGESCDAQSDLFSLGCVMYALCTGHPPFRADSVYGVMQRHNANIDIESTPEQGTTIRLTFERLNNV